MQAQMARIRRPGHGASLSPEEAHNAAGGAAATPAKYRTRWWSIAREVTDPAESLASWLGLPIILMVFLGASCVVSGLIWQTQRHPPLPPQALQVTETLIQGFARQTTYRVPDSIETVRAFYQRELPKQGWRYCGTQATPRCTNLIRAGAEDEIEVYRRPDDRDFTGLTIEIWARRDRDGQTFVTVFETRVQQ